MYYTIIKCGLWPPFIPAINGEAYCLSFVVHTVLSQVSAHSRESTHSRVSTHPPVFAQVPLSTCYHNGSGYNYNYT